MQKKVIKLYFTRKSYKTWNYFIFKDYIYSGGAKHGIYLILFVKFIHVLQLTFFERVMNNTIYLSYCKATQEAMTYVFNFLQIIIITGVLF